MDIESQRKIAAILRILSTHNEPLGSTRIARELNDDGIVLKGRMVRYYLEEMDRLGFTENLGRPGRHITEKGRAELDRAVAVDRMGFVSARVDELAYKTTFDLDSRKGSVILNLSSFPSASSSRVLSVAREVINAGLGMGHYVKMDDAGSCLEGENNGMAALGTVCSVTLNGILYSHGIPVVSRFGGLLEMEKNRPVRFTQIIHYDGTTIDPIEIFIKGKMTSVALAARTGTGTIGASFREIPAAALPRMLEIRDQMLSIGLNGILMMGEPGTPLLDVPVTIGRVGLIVAAGINPMAAVEEQGIPTENRAMKSMSDFSELRPISEI